MPSLGELNIKFKVNVGSAVRDIDRVAKALKRLQSNTKRSTSRITNNFTVVNSSVMNFRNGMQRASRQSANGLKRIGRMSWIARAGLVALAYAGVRAINDIANAITELTKESTKMAMNVEGANLRVQRAFGTSAKEVNAFIDNQARSFGLARSEALNYAGTFGNLFKTTGRTQEETAKLTVNYLKLASIIKSQESRFTMEQILDKLRSGVLGNIQAIDDLVIEVKTGMIEVTESFKKVAGDRSWDQLDFQTQQMIRNMAILEQGANVYGKTMAKTTSASMQQFTATMQNATLALGQAFLPILQKILPYLVRMAEFLEQVALRLKFVSELIFGVSQATVNSTDGATKSQKGLADQLGDTAKEAKKMLLPFDELNNLQENASAGGIADDAENLKSVMDSINFGDADGNVAEMLDNMGFTQETMDSIYEFRRQLKVSFKQIKQTMSLLFDIDPDASWVEFLNDIFKESLDSANDFLKDFNDFMTGFNTVLQFMKDTGILDVLKEIFGILNDLSGITLDPSGTFEKLLQRIDKDMTTEKIAKTLIENYSKAFQAVYENSAEWLTKIWELISEWFQKIYEVVSGKMESVRKVMSDYWSYILDGIVFWWKSYVDTIKFWVFFIRDKLKQWWENVRETISLAWQAIQNTIAFWWTSIYNTIGEWIDMISNISWDSVKNAFKSVWTGIKDDILGVIDSISRAIDTFISALPSKIAIGKSNFAKSANLESSGIQRRNFNGGQIDLPIAPSGNSFSPKIRRASGGIVSSPTKAMIGEGSSPEAIVPLSEKGLEPLISGVANAVLQALEVSGGLGTQQNNSDQAIVLNIDGREIARVLYPFIDKEQKRKGQNIIFVS